MGGDSLARHRTLLSAGAVAFSLAFLLALVVTVVVDLTAMEVARREVVEVVVTLRLIVKDALKQS